MKAIQISRTGGTDVLDYVDLPTPTPGPGEVLIRARAIGVNFFDVMIRTGRYRWMPKLPFVLGNETSGQIAAVGAGVTTLRAGQKVFIAGYDIGNRGGLYAEYVAAPAAAVWPLPESIDFDAATTLTNYQLAWLLLHRAARGVEAKHVAIYGAAGGVGTALIDVARAAGAAAIGIAGGREKRDFVTGRGATAIDYRTEDVAARVKAASGGHGADIVFTHLAGRTLADGVKMLAPLGMVVSYAILTACRRPTCSRTCATTSKPAPRYAASPCILSIIGPSRVARRWAKRSPSSLAARPSPPSPRGSRWPTPPRLMR
jgi:NADPH:quinone reductase